MLKSFLKQFEKTAFYAARQHELAQNERWRLVSGPCRGPSPALRPRPRGGRAGPRGSGRGLAFERGVRGAARRGLRGEALLLVAVVDGAAGEVTQPEQRHVLHVGRQRGRFEEQSGAGEPAGGRGGRAAAAALAAQAAPAGRLALGRGAVLWGGFLREPGAVGRVPEAGGLVSGALDFVQLRGRAGRSEGHVNVSPVRGRAPGAPDGELRGRGLLPGFARGSGGRRGRRGWLGALLPPGLGSRHQERGDALGVLGPHGHLLFLFHEGAVLYGQSGVDHIWILQMRATNGSKVRIQWDLEDTLAVTSSRFLLQRRPFHVCRESINLAARGHTKQMGAPPL